MASTLSISRGSSWASSARMRCWDAPMPSRLGRNGTCSRNRIRRASSDSARRLRATRPLGLATPSARGDLDLIALEPTPRVPRLHICEDAMHDLDALNVLFGDAVQVSDARLTVARPDALA